MFLTFEVISANASQLGVHRRKVFTVDGGRIGRSAENDMVLPGVGVHRHHATVRFINGVFFVEGVGTNGVAINDPDRVLPRNEPYPLRSGDKVFIDEYEVAVTASATAPAQVPVAAAASSAGGAGMQAGGSAREWGRSPEATGPGAGAAVGGGVGSRTPIAGSASDSAEDLDPLRKLTGSAPAQPRVQRPVESSWNHSSSLQDHFTPPPVQAASPAVVPATAASGNVIPENWDRTSFDRSKLQPPPPPPSSPTPTVRAPASAPLAHGSAGAGMASSHSAHAAQVGHAAPVAHAAQVGHGAHGAQNTASSGARPAQTSATPNTRAMPQAPVQRAASPSSTTATSPFDWDAFLKAAGVDASRVPPETAAVMGDILRSVVQGLIEVLRARSEIKTEFRMPVTQVKVSENNPLKFAANADDAMGNLLGRRNPAYLPPQEAFEDALNDVRFHQLAMLAGVRAGFEHLMTRFDPAQLQETFDRQGKRGGLFSGKGNYWERYAERYQELVSDRDETFRRLFGEEFARAYEQQLSVLKRTRGGAQ
jgi:type VI secretion system protein ImpI